MQYPDTRVMITNGPDYANSNTGSENVNFRVTNPAFTSNSAEMYSFHNWIIVRVAFLILMFRWDDFNLKFQRDGRQNALRRRPKHSSGSWRFPDESKRYQLIFSLRPTVLPTCEIFNPIPFFFSLCRDVTVNRTRIFVGTVFIFPDGGSRTRRPWIQTNVYNLLFAGQANA